MRASKSPRTTSTKVSFISLNNGLYLGWKYNTVLSDEYVAAMDQISRERMMYGARRLADLMVQIYGNTTTEFLQ